MEIFPVEVCDLIIDHVPITKLWDSRRITPNRQLESCAMVCRSWARHSRSRQFKSLDFSMPGWPDYLTPFLDLLSSPHATIAPHVRHISLIFANGEYSMTKTLLMRIASLHALESIFIREYHNHSTASVLPRMVELVAWLGSFANLRHMQLSDSMLESFSQLRDIMFACRGLQSLYIYNLRSGAASRSQWYGLPITAPLEAPTPCYAQPEPWPCPSLQVLLWQRIDCPFEEQFLEWVTVSASSLRIRSINIGWDAVVRHQAVLGRLLRALGPTLKELSIRPPPYFPDTHVFPYEHIDLRYNPRLEMLSLWGCSPPAIRGHILDMVYQVTSGHFRTLNVELCDMTQEQFKTMLETAPDSLPELAGIDTLLQRPNFANLESFNIWVPMGVDSMQKFFPLTTERNLLLTRRRY